MTPYTPAELAPLFRGNPANAVYRHAYTPADKRALVAVLARELSVPLGVPPIDVRCN